MHEVCSDYVRTEKKKDPLAILAEREVARILLPQLTDGGIKQSFKSFTIDPKTRYKEIPKKFDEERVRSYYDSDCPKEAKVLEDALFREKPKGVFKTLKSMKSLKSVKFSSPTGRWLTRSIKN